jgi:NADP-dependent 3-hydroxy acid dehydrogenase YdfG
VTPVATHAAPGGPTTGDGEGDDPVGKADAAPGEAADPAGPVAVITGASAGIGAATARRLHAAGFRLVLGARRADRLAEVAGPLGATAIPLDVCDAGSVAAFCSRVGRCDVLVNAAGGALGVDRIEAADDERWRWMYEANVIGTMRMIRTLLPRLEARGEGRPGHIVNLGSVAGVEPYPGGGGYNAAKFAVHAMTKVARMELLGRPVRITEILPGAVETEFSLVRFGGDAERARKVYEGYTPLDADDVADAIVFAVTRRPNVNVDEIVLRSIDQATVLHFNRRTLGGER